MVIQSNKQFYAVNKHINAFIEETTALTPEQKEQLASEWKVASQKLKGQMYRNITKKTPRIVSKYLYFCADERSKIKAENPGIDIKSCTCLLGKAWQEFKKNPDPERMEKYNRLFEIDRKRYYDADLELKVEAEQQQQQKKKNPRSAYLVYCAKQREKDPKITLKQLSIGWASVKQNPQELKFYTS